MNHDKGVLAIYPGSFDPPTNGHIDLIKRASRLFPRLIVAVTNNRNKVSCFPLQKRLDVLRKITKGMKGVTVEEFSGLLVDYVKSKKAKIIIRGLRAVSDFDYEFQLALMNRKLFKDLETVFLMPDEKYVYLSSSVIREVARLNGDVRCLVPPEVKELLKEIRAE